MTFWNSQKDVNELVVQQYTDDIVYLCGLGSHFTSPKWKLLIPLTTGSTCLN